MRGGDICQKEGCEKPAADRQIYCSKAHAPLAHITDRDHIAQSRINQKRNQAILSAPTVKSSTPAHGGALIPSSRSLERGKETTKTATITTQNFEKKRRLESRHILNQQKEKHPERNIMSDTRKNSTKHGWTEDAAREKERERSGENGMRETEKPTLLRKKNVDGRETQLEDFLIPKLPLEGEISQPKSLLDDSIYHLHGLMKSVGKEIPKDRVMTVPMISAQCNLAKNLRDMMKLKLEVYKESRK